MIHEPVRTDAQVVTDVDGRNVLLSRPLVSTKERPRCNAPAFVSVPIMQLFVFCV